MFTKEDIIRGFEVWYSDLYKEEDQTNTAWIDFTPEQQAECLISCMEENEA